MKKHCFLIGLVIFLVSSCSPLSLRTAISLPKIDRYPAPFNFNRGSLIALPLYDPHSPQSPDLRSYDLAGLDLRNNLDYLLLAQFDDQTIWPESDRMPAGLDIETIMENGKNPGLGIRQLHAQGYTGEGVGIAIIDQKLLVDHIEYVDQLMLYEELDDIIGGRSVMHGAAVASIAVGQSVGVAPDADLYYIATNRENGTDFSYLAVGIDRILEINRQIPTDRRIRVITMQIGWNSDVCGYEELMAAIERAMAEGILVISSSLEDYTPFRFNGLGRSPLNNPEEADAYLPGFFWADRFYAGDLATNDRLLVPMDARALASPTGIDEYVFYSKGGWSWAMPYIAGVYALAVEADPSITPDEFWQIAMETGSVITIEHEGIEYRLGPIIDPGGVIAALAR